MARLSICVNDDITSFCGSVSGGAFVSSRRRNTCTLRKHSVISCKSQTGKYRQGSAHFHGQQLSPSDLTQEANKDDFSLEQLPCEAKSSKFNKSFHHYRIIVAMFAGLSVGLMLMLRYNLTVAILKMVNQTDLYLKEHPNSTYEEFIELGYTPGGEFSWNNEIQQLLMSLYMIAYTLPQVPLSRLGERIGSRISVSTCTLICSVANLMIPIVAYWGWPWIVVMRLINGLGAAALFPLALSLVNKWMSYKEITLGITVFQFSQSSMAALNPLIAGVLSDINWKYAFVVPGLVGLVFSALWFIMITDDPTENWFVSQKELDQICGCADSDSTTNSATIDMQQTDKKPQHEPYSATWWELMRNPTYIVYLLVWSLYCSSYCPFTYVIPSYLGQFLKVPVSAIGSYCFVIQLGQLVAMAWPHFFMQILENKFNISKKNTFRIVYAVICFFSAGTWIFLGALHTLQPAVMTLNRSFHASQDVVVVASLMSSFIGSESLAFSIMNTIGNFTTVLVSAGIGRLLDYTARSVFGWSLTFYQFALHHFITIILFCTVITSEPMNLRPKGKKNDDNSPEATNETYKANGKQTQTKTSCNKDELNDDRNDDHNSAASQH